MAKLKEYIMTRIIIGNHPMMIGHNHFDTFFLLTNYQISEIQMAYRRSCRATGIQFNNRSDYVQNGKSYGTVWTNCREDWIKPEEAVILKEFGILTDKFMSENSLQKNEEGFITGFTPRVAAEVILRFIAYSMPEDFEYKFLPRLEKDTINGDLNVTPNSFMNGFKELDEFGYGLYRKEK